MVNNLFHLAIREICPNAKYISRGNVIKEWHSIDIPQPTDIEIIQKIHEIESAYAFKEYQRVRAQEYPPIGDQLDALWKGGEAAAEMLAKVQAVKAKYPKPE